MIEWQNDNRFNGFNSWKGLTYYENYKKIIAWLNGETDYLPPPVECNLDPIAYCNLSCYFCIVQRYLKHHREEIGDMLKLPRDYMLRLVDFLAGWGVRGLCISGGGDPSLHEATPEVLLHAKTKGLDTSFFTNGVKMPDALIEAIVTCKWLVISVDAGDREIYKKIKGRDCFDRVIANIRRLVQKREQVHSDTFMSYVLVILEENQYSIFETCKIAKELGVQSFRLRPVDLQRVDLVNVKPPTLDIPRILEQFDRCHEIEDKNFRVFTTTHKYDSNFKVKHDFSRCLAPPLLLPSLTDGNAYLCVDKKMEAEFSLGSCYPNPEKILDWWGGEKHRQLMKSVDITKCSRCTFGEYNAQIENVVLKDKMHLAFP